MLEVVADDGGCGVRPVELRGDRLVQVGAERLRHRLVHGLADECVLEAEAVRFAHDVGPDQPAPHELEHAGVRLLLLVGRDQLQDGVEREAAADHRGTLEHRALPGIEPVEPSVEDTADRAAQRDLLALLAGEGRELLDEQRIALRELGDALAHGGRRVERVEQAVRVQAGQRLEPQRRLRPRQPLRPSLRQLGPRDAEEQHACGSEADREVLDQVEQRLLGPVDVVEHCDERLLAGEILEQAPRRGEHLVARALEHALVAAGMPERLANRRERRPLAVRRAARHDDARLALEGAEQLARQPRLADAGVADDGHEADAGGGGLAVARNAAAPAPAAGRRGACRRGAESPSRRGRPTRAGTRSSPRPLPSASAERAAPPVLRGRRGGAWTLRARSRPGRPPARAACRR